MKRTSDNPLQLPSVRRAGQINTLSGGRAVLCAASAGLLLLASCGVAGGDLGLENTERTEQAVTFAQDPVWAGTSISITDTAGSFDCDSLGGLCSGFDPADHATPSRTGRGSNSQLTLKRNLYLGDINADGKTDLIQHDAHRVFVSEATFEHEEIGHLVLKDTIQRLIVGDFIGEGWDQLCVLSSEALHCFGADPSGAQEELRLWFRQVSNPIAAAEDVIVGNFDADPASELFIYNKSSGAYRMLEYKNISGVRQMAAKTTFKAGNLNPRLTANMQVRAGDYTGDGKTDLIAINSSRQMLGFAAAHDDGKDTFWWQFTTAGNTVASSEEYFLARVNSDAKDDLVLHDQTSGAVRFKRVEFNDGNPRLLSTSAGDVQVLPGSQLRPKWTHSGSPEREDLFLLGDTDNYRMHSYHAITNGSGTDTYSWRWTKLTLLNDSGWPSTQVKKTLFVPCMFSDNNAKTVSNSRLDALPNRLRDYFWELTMRRIDLQYERTDWVQVDFASTSDDADSRSTVGRECAEAAGKDPSDYDVVVVIKNTEAGGAFWNSGRYNILSPETFDVFLTAHEIGHSLGMSHAPNDNPVWEEVNRGYGNPWNVMSAGMGFDYINDLGVKEGPGLTAPTLRIVGATNPRRIRVLQPGYSKQKIIISAVNRPAAGYFNELQLRKADSTTWMYSVEFREPSGFDKNIPRPTVIIHYTRTGDNGGSLSSGTLQASQDGVYDSYEDRHGRNWVNSERQPGESWYHESVGTVKVLRFINNMAELELTPP